MQSVLIVIHLIVVLALVGTVLLQRSEGGGLGIGGGGGGGGFMTSRGAASALTRATAFLAVAFFATSIVLTILSRGAGTGTSIIDSTAGGVAAPPPAAGEAPTGDGQGILNQLQQLQGGSETGAGGTDTGPQVPQSQ